VKVKFIHIVFLLLFLFTGFGGIVHAQNNNYQLAEQYFRQGEFDKAADYYLKTYKKTKALPHFDKYVIALTNAKEYDKAVKALKKEIKKRPNYYALQVNLGTVYLASGDKESANKTWDNVIKALPEHQGEIIPIAYLFTKKNQPQYAIKAYEVGKKYLTGFYSYYPQMADLYGLIGDYDNMIDLYLELIEFNSGYLQTVQNYLNRNFDFTEQNANTQLLKQKLLQKTNKYPDNPTYSEMLIWMNLQQSNFSGAFVQVKSLDRRFQENGSRLINFARLARKNSEYDIAISAYQIVIRKGGNLPYYETATTELLTTKKMSLDVNPTTPKKSYEPLIIEYENTIIQFGLANFMAPTIRELAQIYAQKTLNPEKSIEWLEKLLDDPSLKKREIALTKIDLGDYLLMTNKVWEAVLYYMQAEKAFKYDELGDEAKLRAAKVAYYTGDFSWAAAKLGVLKGSTSKLIANDALYLSNLITDNTTIDTNMVPMQMYARADLLFVQQNYVAAINVLDSIQTQFPGHMLIDEVHFQKYKIYLVQGKYTDAETQLRDLYTGFGYDILGDDAVYYLGQLYEIYLNDPEQAMEYYLILMTDYTDSIFVTDARKRYRKLRGDSV